jgi:hypothetical protein
VMLKVLTHNIMLIAAAVLRVFYRAGLTPFYFQEQTKPE